MAAMQAGTDKIAFLERTDGGGVVAPSDGSVNKRKTWGRWKSALGQTVPSAIQFPKHWDAKIVDPK